MRDPGRAGRARAGGHLLNAPGPDTRCVACGGRLKFFGPRLGYAYYRCGRCGTLQLMPVPSADELTRAYRDDYAASGHINTDPAEWTAAAAPHYRAVLAALVANGARGEVIDFGGGWGGLCRMMIDAGLDARVVEPSADMAAYCEQVGIPVVRGDIGSIPASTASALVLAGVFEHLTGHRQWLARAHGVIRPGGLLVLMTPTARCASFLGTMFRLGRTNAELPALHQTFCPPWHTALFSVRGLIELAESASFRLVEVRPGQPGRARGLLGLAQRALTLVNRVGWAAAGTAWPLCVTHIFVFRRV